MHKYAAIIEGDCCNPTELHSVPLFHERAPIALALPLALSIYLGDVVRSLLRRCLSDRSGGRARLRAPVRYFGHIIASLPLPMSPRMLSGVGGSQTIANVAQDTGMCGLLKKEAGPVLSDHDKNDMRSPPKDANRGFVLDFWDIGSCPAQMTAAARFTCAITRGPPRSAQKRSSVSWAGHNKHCGSPVHKPIRKAKIAPQCTSRNY